MRMKFQTLVAAVVGLTLIVSGCGGAQNSGNGSPSGDQQQEKFVVNVGYENNPGEPIDLAANKWKELAEQKSNGRLELRLFPSSQLGTKADLTEQMRNGANVVTLSDGSFLDDFVPDMGILMGPYLADSEEDMFKLFESDWFKGISDQLQEHNVHILTTNWLYGVRHVIANKPATTPEQFKGMKLRVPNADMFIRTIELMGATPTPMPLGDVYPSLTQGVIDGMENPLTVIYGSKTQEQAKHIILTGHLINITTWIAGQKFVETLPDDLLTILKETGDEAGDFMTETVRKSDDETIAKLKEEGVTVHEVDREAFKAAVKPIYDTFPEWTPGLYDTVQNILKN